MSKLMRLFLSYIFILPVPVFADMVAHWDFNGTTGTVIEESVSGNNGQVYGGASLNGSGKIYLDGADDYVSLPVGSIVSGLGDFTITAKINFSGQGGAWQRIFTFSNSTSEFMDLVFTNTADDEVLFKFRHTINNDIHDQVAYATTYSSLAGEHFFTITSTASTNDVRVYVDGQLAGENRWATYVPSILGTTANNWLGKSEYSAGAYFKGYFDDFAIYNTALTAAQVSTLAGYGGAIEPSPLNRAMGTDFGLTLSWQASSGSNNFDVYFSIDSSAVVNAVNTLPVGGVYKGRVNQKSFTVSDLNPGTTYYWRVDEISIQGNPVKGKIWQFTTVPAGTPVKIMCFNIKYDSFYGISNPTDPDAWIYTFGTDRRDRVINMILSESEAFGTGGPDIVGTQEATNNQVTDLKNALTGYSFYGMGVDGDTAGGKAGIFYRTSRFTKLNSGTFWLSETPDTPGSKYPGAAEPRIASWLILRDSQNQKSYFVLNTHWDHISSEANIYSAGLIRDKIAALSGGLPVIMMGDLNTYETQQAYLKLIGREDLNGVQYADAFRSVYPRVKEDELSCHGWSGCNGGSRIDFIFCNNKFIPGRAAIERKKVLERYPSDHYPVTATMYFQNSLPTDLNNDGITNLKDLAIFAADWFKSAFYMPADQAGLVGHWDFEGQAGDTAVPDLAGSNNALIFGSSLNGNGGVTLAGGKSVQYVDLGAGLGSIIPGLNDCTIITDFVWDGNSAGTYQKIWTLSQEGTTQFATLTFVSNNEYYIRYQHRYSSHDEESNASTPLLKGHHQVAIAMNSVYGDYGSVQIYLDGVQEAFHTQTRRADLSLIGSTTRNYLGKSPYDLGNYFDGTINDFRIYNRCLSAQEIADIYNGTPGQAYVPLRSKSNFYGDEIVNCRDLAIFVNNWLESQ